MTTQLSWCVALLQGRARPTLAQLYNWRYRQLGNLPNVETGAVGLHLATNPAVCCPWAPY